MLRIEDTDTKRNVADGEKSQMDNLHWLGIDWDEGPDKGGDFGPYRQSERKDIYDKLIKQLVDKGFAYESYRTEEELKADREAQKARHEMPHYEYEYEGMSEAERRMQLLQPRPRDYSQSFGSTFRLIKLMSGTISLKAKFQLMPTRLAAILSFKNVMACRRITLRWLSMTI